MNITTVLQMDFSKNVPGHICAKQGDTNSRHITLRLYDSGIPWTIPETAVPVIRYQCLPGGSCGVYDTLEDGSPAWEFSGNELRVILAPQILAEAGTAMMDVALQDGGSLLATYNIHVHVESSPQEGTALQQSDYFNLAKITATYEELKEAAAISITAVGEACLATIPVAVATWLDTHPEATTTVQDGSVTVQKTNFIHYVTAPDNAEPMDCTLDSRIAVPQAVENAAAIAALVERVAALEKLIGK